MITRVRFKFLLKQLGQEQSVIVHSVQSEKRSGLFIKDFFAEQAYLLIQVCCHSDAAGQVLFCESPERQITVQAFAAGKLIS